MVMIRINLAPIEEMENSRWWLPDAGLFVVLFAVSFAGVEYHFSRVAEQAEQQEKIATDYKNKQGEMQKKLKDFNEREKKIIDLEQMYTAISKITESKLAKYSPIILVEHFQNLKPDGVWLDSWTMGPSDKPQNVQTQANSSQALSPKNREITVTGKALDSILVAEFLTQLIATGTGERDTSDLRTLVYFNKVSLAFSNAVNEVNPGKSNNNISVKSFKMTLSYSEQEPAKASAKKISELIGSDPNIIWAVR